MDLWEGGFGRSRSCEYNMDIVDMDSELMWIGRGLLIRWGGMIGIEVMLLWGIVVGIIPHR